MFDDSDDPEFMEPLPIMDLSLTPFNYLDRLPLFRPRPVAAAICGYVAAGAAGFSAYVPAAYVGVRGSIGHLVLVALIATAAIAVLYLLGASTLVHGGCKIVGGKGTLADSIVAFGLAALWPMVAQAFITLAVATSLTKLATRPPRAWWEPVRDPTLIETPWFHALLQAPLGIWFVVLLFVALSRVHRMSVARAVGGYLVACVMFVVGAVLTIIVVMMVAAPDALLRLVSP